jgi:N-acetylglucosamine-6-phosphate deacetylase
VGSLWIRGGSVDLAIRDGVIAEEEPAAPTAVLDAAGCTVVPGFVDVQINGGFGVDLTSEPERVRELAAALPATGVTSFVPTVVSAPREIMAHAVDVLTTGTGSGLQIGSARPVGVHLEGPFVSEPRRGANAEGHLRPPTLDEVRSWVGVTMVTLAPELGGALEVIRELVGRGVVVCVGHSLPTASTECPLAVASATHFTATEHHPRILNQAVRCARWGVESTSRGR